MTSPAQRLAKTVDAKLRVVLARRDTIEEILPKLIKLTNVTTAQLKDLNQELAKTRPSIVNGLERLDSDDIERGVYDSGDLSGWFLEILYDKALHNVEIGEPVESLARLRRAAQLQLGVVLHPYRTRLMKVIDAIAAYYYSAGQKEELAFITSMLEYVKTTPAQAYQLSKVEDAGRYLDKMIRIYDKQLLPRVSDLSHQLRKDSFISELFVLQNDQSTHEIKEEQWKDVIRRSLDTEWSPEQQRLVELAEGIWDQKLIEGDRDGHGGFSGQTYRRLRDYRVAIMLPRYSKLRRETDEVSWCWEIIEKCERKHKWPACDG